MFFIVSFELQFVHVDIGMGRETAGAVCAVGSCFKEGEEWKYWVFLAHHRLSWLTHIIGQNVIDS